MIEPTLGRIVWFHPWAGQKLGHETSGVASSDTILAAIVTFVHGPRMVNLTAFDQYGHPFPVTSARLIQPEDPRPPPGFMYCEWIALPERAGREDRDA